MFHILLLQCSFRYWGKHSQTLKITRAKQTYSMCKSSFIEYPTLEYPAINYTE